MFRIPRLIPVRVRHRALTKTHVITLTRQPTRGRTDARSTLRVVLIGIAAATALCASAACSEVANAQGGMGRGGGGGGGRGGMGGRGGGGQGGMSSPAEAAKKNLEHSDPIKFLLDQKKPLSLTNIQRDTLKLLQKEMKHMQEPLLKDLEKLTSQSGRGGEGGRGRGMGRGGGGRGTDQGGPGSEGESPEGARGRGGPPGVREIFDKLTDIQDAYRDRARTHLSETQRGKADSLFDAALAKDRAKAEEEREKRSRSR